MFTMYFEVALVGTFNKSYLICVIQSGPCFVIQSGPCFIV